MKFAVSIVLFGACVVASSAAPAITTVNWLEVELAFNEILDITALVHRQVVVIAKYENPTVGDNINRKFIEVFVMTFPTVDQTYKAIEDKSLSVEQAELFKAALEDVLLQNLDDELSALSIEAASQIRDFLGTAYVFVDEQTKELIRLLQE